MNLQTTSNGNEPMGNGMKWLIAVALAVLAMIISSVRANAQIVSANPLEWAALAEGNELINGQTKDETEGQTKTAILQNSIAAEFDQIHKWERKYNSYLKTVSGYASTLKAATHLYNDGVRLFFNLCNIKRAIASNPQGIAATFSMNDLYMETATELITVYTTLRDAVAKGGKENMLTGAERSKTLWELNDRLEAFNRKLSKLSLSLRYYTMMDVWYNITEGIIDRSVGDIARQAHGRWVRAARVHY